MTERTALATTDDDEDDELVVTQDDELGRTDDEAPVVERLDQLTELARALTGVGATLSEVSWQLAMAPAEQAVTIYRELMREGFLPPPDLGNALSKLLTYMSEMSTCATTDASGAGERAGQ